MSSITNFTITETERRFFNSDYEPWYHSHSKYDGRVQTSHYSSNRPGRPASPFGNFTYDTKKLNAFVAYKKFTEQWLKINVVQQYQIIPGYFSRL